MLVLQFNPLKKYMQHINLPVDEARWYIFKIWYILHF